MASTPLLGLSLPADGTTNWGTLVNTSITALLDSAIAGTTTLTTDADITLSSTTEATNEARQAIILWKPPSGTATRTITAPAKSKTYVVINATGGTQSIIFRGIDPITGPTTGVTIPAGKVYMLAWNGTDFVIAGGVYGQATVSVDGLIKLGDATVQSVAANAVTATAARTYALQLNSSGQGVINVPWTDTVYTLPTATAAVLGGIKLGDATVQSVAANAVTATASRTYALQVNASGQGLVNVPWTDTTYTLPTATNSVLGGIKLGDATVQSVAANAVTATASRTYAVQLTSTGNAVVNVPWTDTSSTAPGGSNTQVQFNNSGAFGGSANFVFDGTNVGIGTNNPTAYGKLTVLGTAGPIVAVVTTSTDVAQQGYIDFRKTTNIGATDTNQIGRISFYSRQGTTEVESAYINVLDNRQSGVSSPELLLNTYINGVGAGARLKLSKYSELVSYDTFYYSATNGHTFAGAVNFEDAVTAHQVEFSNGYGITWDTGGASKPTQSYASRVVLGNTVSSMNFASPGIQYVFISAGAAGAAGLWLDPSVGGSGQIGTYADYNLNFYRNQVLYQTLAANGTVLASGKNLGLGGTSPSTSGAGITFPATQSSSSDANTLDDYEEGTWTPTAYGNVTAGTTTYDANGQQGRYTKIGRQVTVSGYLSVLSSTGVGALTVGGLPFNSLVGGAGNLPNYVGSITFTNLTNGNATNTLTSMFVLFGTGTNAGQVRYVYGSPGLSNTYSIISGAFTLEFTLTYFTAT